MSELIADLKYSARTLRKSPGFSIVAVLTLALGIGANTAIFSVVNGVVLKPLGYASPERLVSVASQFPTLNFDRFWLSPPEFFELREWTRTLEVVGGYRTGQASVGGTENPVRVTSASATWGFFRALGVSPVLGRTYTEEEDLPNAAPVTVLSYELWQSAFGGSRDVVGRTAIVNGIEREIVGVMPRGFDIDEAGVQIWAPVAADPSQRTNNRGSHFLNVVGRLAPGVTIEQARSELENLLRRWEAEFAGMHAPSTTTHRLVINSMQAELIGSVKTALFLLLGAVGFVLLIACANVANLQLARAESRQTEIAVRSALGAGRGRLIRQFLTEAMFYSLIGGVAGLGLAMIGTRVLLATSPQSVPRADEIAVDPPVLLFTLGVSVLTGLLFGLAPLLNLTRRTTNAALREGGTRTTAGRARQQLRRLLVVSETALAVILAIGSALMLRSFAALQRVDAGFDPESVLTFGVFLPASQYANPEDQLGFYERLISGLSVLPGVQKVAAMSGLPPQRNVVANDMQFEGYAFVPNTGMAVPNADHWQFVTPDYLETMQIPLVSGRGFTAADGPESGPVVLINEKLARVFYPNQDPLGRRLRPGFGPPDRPWFTIVGVVKDVKQNGIEAEVGTEVYWHYPQIAATIGLPRSMNVVMRTSGSPLSTLEAARAELRRLDPQLPMSNPRALEDVVYASIARPRFMTLLLGIFAAVALSLAAVGTYGVMSYAVTQRRREMGVRMALGAESRNVLGLVLRQGLGVAAVGLGIGVAGAFALSRLMRTMLFEIAPTDFLSFVAAPALLALVATAACWIPAYRASRLDPVRVLRQE
jgi:putative ABC transport system permease protein